MRIRITNLHHVYGGAVEALRGINLSIQDGEAVLLLGHNGAGKSTLVKHLNGILKPTSGDVFIGETNTKSHEVSDLAHYVALSFQNPDDQIFSSTVLDEVTFGPRNLAKQNFAELADEALHLLGLADIAASHPYDLHPSKRKMLTIASAIAMDTPIVAFDEPTAGFDMRQRGILGQALERLKERKKTVLLVSHDIDYSLEFCDSIVLMDRGRVTFHGNKLDFADRPDARELLRNSGLSLPILWRMSRAIGMKGAPSSIGEFAHMLAHG
ncbi:MAG: ABC transporter ATP-binding protein [Bacteroidota bacterium]